ncbi:tail fiber domain-containing protein [Candidatus Cloacimonadota bacterium]
MLKKTAILIFFILTVILNSETFFEVTTSGGESVFSVTSSGLKIFGMRMDVNGDYLYIRNSADSTLMTLGGTGMTLNTSTGQQLMVAGRDSVRFYINELTDESRGGFAISSVGARDGSNFLNLTPENYFIGHEAGQANTTGLYNTFIGYRAGSSNTAGSNNVFLGYESGRDNTEGIQNVFIGYQSGAENLGVGANSGDYNVFIGYLCGKQNVQGQSNVFIGDTCGMRNTDGQYNVFLGKETGENNLTGNYNVYLGSQSGASNQSGSSNTFVGYLSGYNDTASNNTFIGHRSAYDHITGEGNTFVGNYSGWHNTSGAQNTIIGDHAGDGNYIGSGNVFLGYRAGQPETGSNKLYIENTSNDFSNALIYGDFENDDLRFNANVGVNTAAMSDYGLKVSGGSSYALYLVGSGYATGGFVDGSDERWKENIQPIENALQKVKNLRGVSYDWKQDEYPQFNFDNDKQIGFLAQEVNEILPEIVKDDGAGNLGIDYSKITPILVEAVKQQQQQINELNEMIDKMEELLDELKD